jgi:hypothetical protein
MAQKPILPACKNSGRVKFTEKVFTPLEAFEKKYLANIFSSRFKLFRGKTISFFAKLVLKTKTASNGVYLG